jgi:hypothetical protein
MFFFLISQGLAQPWASKEHQVIQDQFGNPLPGAVLANVDSPDWHRLLADAAHEHYTGILSDDGDELIFVKGRHVVNRAGVDAFVRRRLTSEP